MDNETMKLVDECETTWPDTSSLIPSVTLDDAPLTELKVKAHAIFAGEHYETLDALVCRLADAIPEGVTEDNFSVAKPLAGACKKWFSQVEKLRKGLKRPALDWGDAVDGAAKELVDRAGPTLNPIITAVKSIEVRRKADKFEREAAEAKRLADEEAARVRAIQDAEREKIEAEQDAERSRLEQIAHAQRIEAERLAAERKEMEELKAWLAEREAKADDRSTWPETLRPDFDDNAPPSLGAGAGQRSAKLTQRELDSIMYDAETATMHSKAGVEVHESYDQQKVRDFGDTIAEFKDTIVRPLVVKHEANQMIELAIFDLCEIAKRLQEWRMP